MKILHSADWHLDSPLQGHTTEQTALLRRALLAIPGKIAALCRAEKCDMMLLSGDLFDGPYTADSLNALRDALSEVAVPVFIAPGNHDYLGADSPWLTQSWPENVHIFTQPVLTAMEGPGCTVYGAGFTSMDCPSLLEGFHAEEKTPSVCSTAILPRSALPIALSPASRSRLPALPIWPWVTSTRAATFRQAIPCAPGPAAPWAEAMTSRAKRAC